MMKLVQYICNALLMCGLVVVCLNYVAGCPLPTEVTSGTFSNGVCGNLSLAYSSQIQISYDDALKDLKERANGLKMKAECVISHMLEAHYLHIGQDNVDYLDTFNFMTPVAVSSIITPTIDALKRHHSLTNEHMQYVIKVLAGEKIGGEASAADTKSHLEQYRRDIASFKCSISLALIAAGYKDALIEESVVLNDMFLNNGNSYEEEVQRAYIMLSSDGIDLFSTLREAYDEM